MANCASDFGQNFILYNFSSQFDWKVIVKLGREGAGSHEAPP